MQNCVSKHSINKNTSDIFCITYFAPIINTSVEYLKNTALHDESKYTDINERLKLIATIKENFKTGDYSVKTLSKELIIRLISEIFSFH